LVGTEHDVHVRRPANQAIIRKGKINGIAFWLAVAFHDRADGAVGDHALGEVTLHVRQRSDDIMDARLH